MKMQTPPNLKRRRWFSVILMTFFMTMVSDQLSAQESPAAPTRSERKAAIANQVADAKKPEGEEKKEGDKKKDGEASDDKKKEEEGEPSGPKPVTREAATEQANPINEEVKWSEDGVVQFSFRNQPWKNVLQWISDASKLTLQWQELPGDALNLTTTRSYSLEESRDLLNRLLLSRGYTMLVHGEILQVFKLSELKSSLVPRVSPQQLEELPDHSIVKVSFNLDWLIAEEAAAELKPMLTDAGRINKLSRTNRLEVIDTAVSLRDIWHLLSEEQSDSGQEQLVKTFVLKHRRASDVISLLRPLLGLEEPSGAAGGGAGMNPRMMQQAMQQMQKMMQSAQQNKGGGSAKKEQETRLVLNNRENMILAQAAPDQMAVIEKAIAQIDVPREAETSMLQNMNRMKIYRLETLNPQTLVDLLQELGDLDPGTTLKVDKDKKAIVAWAGIADQYTITTLVERLDSSGREFDVISLRRLDAEYVAGTIMTLMGPKEKEESNSRRRYWDFGYGQQQDEEPESTFRVDADLQDNRLLVYANPVEMEEIHGLLVKLGELPDPNSKDSGYRVFELNPEDNAEAIKQQLEQLWRRGNQLEFNLPEKKPEPEPVSEDDTAFRLDTHGITTLVGFHAPDESVVASSDSVDGEESAATDAEQFFQQQIREQVPDNVEQPPVRISISEDGRLIVASDDPAALAEFEDLLKHVARPAQDFKIFTMKYQSPYWVAMTLQEYFELDEEDDGGYRGFYYYYYGPGSRDKSDKKHSLSQRRIPQFIYDNYTSTILVRDADSRQLQTIEELIKIYDAPSPADTRSMRVTEIFRLRNAKAEVVAQAIKDVFRDLLSSNDKALEKPGGEQKQQSSRGYSYFDGGGGGGDDDDDDPVRFRGLLSIGIDNESNTLVISSQKRLVPTIKAMVEELDKAAEKSSGVRVLQLDPSVDLGTLQDRLSKILGPEKGARRGKNNQPKNNGNGQPVQRGQKPAVEG